MFNQTHARLQSARADAVLPEGLSNVDGQEQRHQSEAECLLAGATLSVLHDDDLPDEPMMTKGLKDGGLDNVVILSRCPAS